MKALYPKLLATYKFDQDEYKSVKCDPLEEGAAYELYFSLTDKQHKELNKICIQVYKKAAVSNNSSKSKWPNKPSTMPYKPDGEKEGCWIGKAKLKGSDLGELTTPPRQVDAVRKALPKGFELTTGSKVNISVTILPYNKISFSGISLRLNAVQLLELAKK